MRVPDFVTTPEVWLDAALVSSLVAVLAWAVLKLCWVRWEWENKAPNLEVSHTPNVLPGPPTIVRRTAPPDAGGNCTKQGSKSRLEQSKNRAQFKPEHGASRHTTVLPPPIPGQDLHPYTDFFEHNRKTTGFPTEHTAQNEAQTVSSEALNIWLDPGDQPGKPT